MNLIAMQRDYGQCEGGSCWPKGCLLLSVTPDIDIANLEEDLLTCA